MKVFIANLDKYNNMEASGEWFDLPVDMDEVYETIFEEHGLDENGQPHGDYAIHDYELPFDISEQENIDNLNELAEYIQNTPEFEPILEDNYDITDVINLANQTGNEELVDDLIHTDDLDMFVESRMESGGWQGVKFMLQNITYTNEEYYRMDGYENMEELPYGYEKDIAKEIMNNVKDEIGVENTTSKSIGKSFGKTDELER